MGKEVQDIRKHMQKKTLNQISSLYHPSLESILRYGCVTKKAIQHPVLLHTKPDKIAAAILNLYGSFFSSST